MALLLLVKFQGGSYTNTIKSFFFFKLLTQKTVKLKSVLKKEGKKGFISSPPRHVLKKFNIPLY